MASKARKRYLARHYMAVKSITQHVPNQGFTLKIQKHKEDLQMSKFIAKIAAQTLNIKSTLQAGNPNPGRLVAQKIGRLQTIKSALDFYESAPIAPECFEVATLQKDLNAVAEVFSAIHPDELKALAELPSNKCQIAAEHAAKKLVEILKKQQAAE